MKSISKSIGNLINTSLKITYPFEEKASIYKNDKNPDYDYYTDISVLLFGKYKDKMLKLWGATNTPPTPQSYSEEILINLNRKHDFLHKISHDFDGKILFKLNNTFVENSIKNLLEKDGNLDEGLKDMNNTTQIGVLFPFGEIIQKIHLNQMRGVNISETLSRIYEYQGFKTHRFSCLQNSAHFHGIVLAYLLEKRYDDNLDLEQKEVKFENLSRFIIEKNLKTDRDIAGFAAKTLQEVSNDEKLWKLFDKLNGIALNDMMNNYNTFIANKEQLTILDTFNINKKMGKMIKELSAKGKVFFSEEEGFYIKLKKDKIVKLMDSVSLLTKEGVFLGFLSEISALDFIEKVVFSTDLQDEIFYENIQEGYEILFDEGRMQMNFEFYGHNSLFLEKKNNEKQKNVFLVFLLIISLKIIAFFSTFLEEIIEEGIKKSMSLSPAFPPNLTPENRSNMQKMILGWLRFRDHQHKKEESYILDLKESLNFIFSEEIVNIRSVLNDKLKDFEKSEKNIKDFKLETVEERVLAVKLLEFVDVLEKVIEEKNVKILTEYLEVLCKLVKVFEQVNKNLWLTKASFIILSKCFYILGVI